jgi:outer membrane protein OmpA-like peptidoglycan-associated protein
MGRFTTGTEERTMSIRRIGLGFVAIALCSLLAGCAYFQQGGGERTTSRDKTKKGAAIGAASGAVLGAVLGEGEADEILAGAAIGAGIGAGVGAYMDRQEEKLARIPGTSVERVEENMLLVHFDSDVLFDVDSALLSQDSRYALDQAASVFAEYPKTAIIAQGHTDSSGSEQHNQQLSERRAQSVVTHLVGQGVDSARITSLGYGEGYPVTTNDTAEGRRLNRRVDLLLKAKAK